MQSAKVKTVRKFNFIRKKRLGTRILLIKDASMAFVICTTAAAGKALAQVYIICRGETVRFIFRNRTCFRNWKGESRVKVACNAMENVM